MRKARDKKVPILKPTTRRGTTLNTSAALDSPSVMSKLLTPPYVDRTATTAESENSSDNYDGASTVLDESGSLGPFLDDTIAKAKQVENAEKTTPVSSPESGEHLFDDPDEVYIDINELDEDLVKKFTPLAMRALSSAYLKNMLLNICHQLIPLLPHLR
jgi:hypothetical protein